VMAIGETKSITIANANKVAMLLFEGTAGQRVSLHMTGVTISLSFITIYKPDGSVLVTGSANTSGGFIDTQTLPVDGTYTILIDPSNTATGNMTLTLYNVVDFTGTITPGGPAVTVTTTIPGQNAKLTFSGTAGQRMSIKGSTTIGACWSVGLIKPDGTEQTSLFSCGSTLFIDPQTLEVSGTYTVLVDPSGAATGQATINLYEVNDITGTINFGGPTVNITTDTPGQNARLTFTGTAGQRASLNGVSASFGTCWNLGIYKPDGTQLANTFTCGSSAFVEPQTLPDSGTYTVVVDPSGAGFGNASVTLYDVSDFTGTIAIGGPSVTVPLPTPGQNGRLTFDGTAGQRISVNSASGTFTSCWTVAILKPDGSQLASIFSCGTSSFIEPQALPVTGTYTVTVDPSGAGTGQVSVSLYEANDVTGTITPNGPAVPVSLPTPGQNVRLTFDGTAGQRISINSVSGTFTSCWNVAILKPDGSQLANVFSCGTSSFMEAQTLPATGTYTLLVDPSGAGTGNVTVNAYEVVDVNGSITIDGPQQQPAVGTPGQTVRLTFSGTAAQRVSINSTAATFTGCWTIAILKPDASQLASVFSCGSSSFLEPQTLPTTGTYTLLVDPSGAATGQVNVNLYGVVDPTGSVTLGGPAVNVSVTTPGQNPILTFSGTTGQQATVRVTSNTMSCVRVTLLKPDGTSMTNTFSCSSAFNLATQTLPVTGTYTITVDPSGANTGSLNLSVTNP
jgi:uncharacterized protein YhfF